MISFNWLRLKFSKEFKYYSGIEDFPVWNWHKLHKENNMKYLIKTDNYDDLEYGNIKELEEVWKKIYQEYIDEFGIDKLHLQYMKTQKKIILLEIDALTGNKIKQTFANLERMKLDDMIDDNKNMNFNEVVAVMIQRMRMNIDTKKMSVLEFYTHLNLLNKN